ncbi:MAG: hypothetical protein ABI591_02685 [Kofleriaceae bacterium]
MPAFIDLIRIDWHLPDTPDHLQEAIVLAHARCTGRDHTLETVVRDLSAAVAAHPELVVDALVDTGYNSFALLHARGGSVKQVAVVELPEGETDPVELPYDDLPFDLEPSYASEAALSDALAALAPTEAGSCVVTAGEDRFLVEVTPESWRIRKLVVASEPALVARLLRGDYAEPKAPPRDPAERYDQALYWPGDMLDFIQQHAVRLDRSLSWIAQYAVKVAKLSSLDLGQAVVARSAAGLSGGDKRKQTLLFPGSLLQILEDEAARLDCSLSTVAQTAIALAKREIEQMPAR